VCLFTFCCRSPATNPLLCSPGGNKGTNVGPCGTNTGAAGAPRLQAAAGGATTIGWRIDAAHGGDCTIRYAPGAGATQGAFTVLAGPFPCAQAGGAASRQVTLPANARYAPSRPLLLLIKRLRLPLPRLPLPLTPWVRHKGRRGHDPVAVERRRAVLRLLRHPDLGERGRGRRAGPQRRHAQDVPGAPAAGAAGGAAAAGGGGGGGGGGGAGAPAAAAAASAAAAAEC